MLPRGQRNNNPGNLDYNPKNKWVGQIGIEQGVPTPRFAAFDCPENGIRALVKVLLSYILRYKLTTVAAIVNRYAPSHENFTNQYISAVEDWTGIGKSKIDPANFDQMYALTTAIIRQELGNQPYHTSIVKEGLRRAGIVQ